MTLSLKDSQTVADLAEVLYSFLPGSGHLNWKGHVTFKTVAEKVGVGDFWQPGSKTPMIVALFSRTLQERRHLLEPLVLEVVRAGITYRHKNNNPITPAEIDTLNGLILQIGFKFPDLWDPEFRTSLEMDSGLRAKQHVERAVKQERLRAAVQSERSAHLAELNKQFLALHDEPDRQAAGLALETVLNRLFALEGLEPREPFRVIGEQIDGSFELDHEVYLVEAKWERAPLPESSLLVFRGKIEGKSAYTRGVFIALNGISAQAKQAITHGKQPTFFLVNGHDVTMVLSEDMGLRQFLRQRQRLLCEEGRVVVPYHELWSGSRAR